MDIKKLILQESEASEANPDERVQRHTTIVRGHDRTKVLSVRLNDNEVSELTEQANRLGIPLSTYVRHLLVQGLAARDEASPADLAREIGAKVDQLVSALDARQSPHDQ